MTIAGDHLCADRFRRKTKFCTDMRFHTWINIGKCPDRTRNRPGRNFRTRRQHTGAIAVHFRIKTGKGQPHSCGFRMDTMTAPDTYGVFVFKRATLERLQ